MDGDHSKAINYRSPAMGNGFASAGWWPMDLQEIYRVIDATVSAYARGLVLGPRLRSQVYYSVLPNPVTLRYRHSMTINSYLPPWLNK
jgi:hypothetical protein